MMITILGAIIYFIIGGIVLGIAVNIMTMIDSDLKDDPDYNIDIDDIGFIGILWPIAVPLFIGIAIIAIVGSLVAIIAKFFTKNKKH